ncbi:hypothetical protein ACT1U9_08595 [Streptomyces sp. BR1]
MVAYWLAHVARDAAVRLGEWQAARGREQIEDLQVLALDAFPGDER